jgi:hypothetical protein
MANYRFRVAEQISATSIKPIKGMSFRYFENASITAQRLSGIHLNTQYFIIDTETGTQYKVERLEKGGKQ